MPNVAEVPLLIVFAGFNRYTAQIERLEDLEVATVMNAWYELASNGITSAGGRVVKFIGDAMLAVFPPEAADRGALALLELKDTADRFMKERRWECNFVTRVHFGTVAAGDFGPRSDRRYDVLGKAVNTAARLDSSGVALSVEAFRLLGTEVRKRFKKHTPPMTYIRLEDEHRAQRTTHR